MHETVRVSILIPAYNVEPYIDQCLESVMNQTLQEIEIIVVDDGSTDATLAHIEAAAKKDSRIRVIRHEVNLGTHMARKSAVLASGGEYIMFVDGDDWIEPDAAEKLYIKMQKTGVDILQYGVFVENFGNNTKTDIEYMEKYFRPYTGKTLTEPLISACFKKKIFTWNIWNKLYKGQMLRSVFSEEREVYFKKANDVFAIFFILLRSKTYLGIEERLYHYAYGRGISGHREMSLELFSLHCQSARVWYALDQYVSGLERGMPDDGLPVEAARIAVDSIEGLFVSEQIFNLHAKVQKKDQGSAYLAMESAWGMGGTGFVKMLARYAWDKRAQIAEALTGADFLKFEGRPIKTIGLYYYRFRNGGAQRVVTQLGSLLAELRDEEGKPKYRVVLISDEAPNEEDYPTSPLVIREQLPPFWQSTAINFAPRADKWQEIIAKHRIDAVFNSQENLNLLWDLLSVKRAEGHPAFLVHVHSFWAIQYKWQDIRIKEWLQTYSLADGVVTLSEIDRQYWSRCNPRSVYIPNPCFVKAKECRRSAYGKHILWLARIANQKQPLEIPRIMREVCARDPEIVCHVVGADDVNLEKELRESIVAESLSRNVIMEGFHTDVTLWYESCSLFLMTSRWECFPLVLFEAASYGLPTVLYELPWLSYNELIDGAVTVPQLDAEAAAEAIVRLVNDPEEWQRRSDAIYDSAQRYEEMDITAYWIALIESLEQGTLSDEPRFDRQTEILLDQIDAFHDRGMSGLMRDRDCEAQKARNLEGELNSIKGSVSFRLGRALTWAPRKVRGLVRCYQEHDAKYTAERILYHLHLGPDNEKRGG